MTMPHRLYSSEPIKAAPKPATFRPSSSEAAHQNISALMTKRNSPSVSSVTGRVSSTSSGRTKVLSKPSTKAAHKAVPKLATDTPEYRLATSNKAAASNIQRTMIFMPAA